MKIWLCVLISIVALPSIMALADELPYYDSPEFTPRWIAPDDARLEGFHQIPAFTFTNQSGEVVTERTVAGKVYVASFFFSTCPGICPAIHSKLALVQEKFATNDDVLILSHSIRPATDTPETLRAYARTNDVNGATWHLLTGERASTYELAKSAYFANEDLGNIEKQDDFLHTENLLLIDQQRRIRGVYNGLSASSVEHLLTDINRLLSESPKTRRTTTALTHPARAAATR